eukprot:5812065-Prorocentrum_lima.AAC.1
MTSSLVGSEMCIRDRAYTENIKTYSGTATEWAQRAINAYAAQMTHTPVSYTHLTLPTICSV